MPANQSHGSNAATPISILACGGTLPLEIAEILRDSGRRTNVVSIKGMADADYSGFSHSSVSIGRIGALLSALRANGAREMVIAGHARRPDLRSLNVDWGFVRHILTILSLTRGGDDHVLRRIAAFFERCGLTVRSIADVAPALLTPPGNLSGNNASDNLQSQAAAGLQLIHQLGPFDVGQAVVMQGGRVLAIEGAEGTDGLLARLPDNTANADATTSDVTAARTLVKAAKPEQDLRIDLPTIGAKTIVSCQQAGIEQIALEAGRSLILSRTETLKRAEAVNIAVVGLASTTPTTPAKAQVRSMRLTNHAKAKPRPQAIRDAAKGLQLLSALAGVSSSKAALVARENILAINLNEPFSEFIERTEMLAQWGDRREKTKRNRTLVLNSVDDIGPDVFDNLPNTKIAGFAILHATQSPAKFDQLVSDANARHLFVLSPE